MRKAKTGAMLGKQLNKPRVVSQNIDRPRLNLMEDSFVKILDRESHDRMLANMRTRCEWIHDAER